MPVTSVTNNQHPNYWFLIAGSLVLGVLWIGPFPELAHHAFFAHMIMHMGVVAVAAPLLALAIAGSGADPVPRAPRLFAPIPASIVELIVVWSFHAPGPHHWARHSGLGLAVEQGSFIAAGVWLWLSAVGGGRAMRDARAGGGVMGMLLTSMHMTLLGALLALAPRPLYLGHHGFGDLSALQDQQLGGAIMLFVGGIAYLAGGLWLTTRMLRRQGVEW